MLYTYGLKLGLKLAGRGKLKQSLRYLIVPVNYWRTIEYRLIYDHSEFRDGDRILDIGSPKLLSLFLAHKLNVEVFSTDIEEYFIEEYQLLRRMQRVSSRRFHAGVQDGRHLTFDDGFFTKVYSLSVLEHIPDTGDTECAREIGRVLADGGRCVITVPFAPQSRDEYKASDFYWAGSSKTAASGDVFYQRRYSEQDLFDRIITPSGLQLKRLKYVGEKIALPPGREICDYLPRPTGPVQPLLSNMLHTAPVNSWRDLKKPLCALIVLEK